MATIEDDEFGTITVRKRRGSRGIRISLGTDGRLIASVPFYTPLAYIKRVISGSRSELRNIVQGSTPRSPYKHGQRIGTSHTLAVVSTGLVSEPTTKVQKQTLLVYVPAGRSVESAAIQRQIRDSVIDILRREAKALLPKRLKALADEHGFSYTKLRFSHAGSRWGSCSTNGTISLNIALMKLPDELIDYVLLHELCHLRHMNHSPAFWAELGKYDPHFRLHKRQIARETPTI